MTMRFLTQNLTQKQIVMTQFVITKEYALTNISQRNTTVVAKGSMEVKTVLLKIKLILH